MLKIGFTGTSHGMNERQKLQLAKYLELIDHFEFHHGDCIGADEEAHIIAAQYNSTIIIHPPENPKKRAFCQSEHILNPKPYLERNKDIVNATDLLLAAPRVDRQELRSGTWSTIRYAIKRNKNYLIIKREG